MLDEAVTVMEDEDGWGVVGMAIQGSCGHREREAVVRAVVGRWGLEAGPRQGKDKCTPSTWLSATQADMVADWTPLHIAAIISTPPLISFLLTRGASTSAVTDRGLTPFDLVAGMPNREEISLLLGNSEGDARSKSPTSEKSGISDDRQEALRKHRARATYEMVRDKDRERKVRREEERELWIREQSGITSVEAELLLPPKRHRGRRSADSGLAWATSDDEDNDSASDDEEEDLSNSVSQTSARERDC
jgi:ankyrin repeat protein